MHGGRVSQTIRRRAALAIGACGYPRLRATPALPAADAAEIRGRCNAFAGRADQQAGSIRIAGQIAYNTFGASWHRHPNSWTRAMTSAGNSAVPHGAELLHHPRLNKATAFTEVEREALGLIGLVPEGIDTEELQLQRVRFQLTQKTTDLEKYIFLSSLQDNDETLYSPPTLRRSFCCHTHPGDDSARLPK